MKTITYLIKDPEGIHARPAGVLVALAKKFSSNIVIYKDENKKVDCKRIFGVMSLCAKANDQITLEIDGTDEDAAFNEIKKCLEENF